MRIYQKKGIFKSTASSTLAAILFYVYRKHELASHCGRYGESVINGLVELNLVDKVSSKKDTFYFIKDTSMKAIDLAKEYLWNFHNTEYRKEINNKRFIYCFDKDIETGQGLVEIEKAIQKCYV